MVLTPHSCSFFSVKGQGLEGVGPLSLLYQSTCGLITGARERQHEVRNDPVDVSVVEVVVVQVASGVELLVVVPAVGGRKLDSFKIVYDIEMVGRQGIFDVFGCGDSFEQFQSFDGRSLLFTDKVGAHHKYRIGLDHKNLPFGIRRRPRRRGPL